MNENVRIAVVGATGVVGREVLSALLDQGLPSERLAALASGRSEAGELDYGEDTLEVEKATPLGKLHLTPRLFVFHSEGWPMPKHS